MDLSARRSGYTPPLYSTIKPKITDSNRESRKKRCPVTYTEPALLKALEEIKNKTKSIYSAAKSYGIPRTTIQYRLSDEYKHRGTRGPHTVFAAEEEEQIVSWLRDKESKGHPITISSLQFKVKSFLKAHPRTTPFVDDLPGKTWIRLFLRRHPELSLRTPESVTLASSRVSEKDIRLWFSRVYSYLLDNNLTEILKDPSRILNGDESGFSLNPVPKKVIGSTGNKNVSFVETTCSKTNITVMFSFAADGSVIPPDVILPQKRLSREILRSFPSNWGIGTSENGWMDTKNFTLYIKKILYPALKKKGTKFPVIYFVDGHSSHTALEAADVCNELGIILIALFPNATRILQPADVAIFRPLKISWAKTLDTWRTNQPGQGVSLTTFGPLLERAMNESFKKSTIINGFSTCGLFPYNPDAIDYSKCIPGHSQRNLESLTTSNDLGETEDLNESFSKRSNVLVKDINETAFSAGHIDDSVLSMHSESIHNPHELVSVPQNVLSTALDLVGLSKITYLIDHEDELAHDDRALLYIYRNILALGSSAVFNETPSNLVDLCTNPSKPVELLTDVVMVPDVDFETSMCTSDAGGPKSSITNIENETLFCSANGSELSTNQQAGSKRDNVNPWEPIDAELSLELDDNNTNSANSSLLKKFLTLPQTPKREKKHRNYKKKSYSVLTAAERLEELNGIEKMKEETAKLRMEKLERRMKKKLEAEEEKKIRQQRIKYRNIQREAEKIKQNETKQKKAEEKQIKQELKRKQKAEMEEKKKIKMQSKRLKTDAIKPRQPLSAKSPYENGSDELLTIDPTENDQSFFELSEQEELDAILGLG